MPAVRSELLVDDLIGFEDEPSAGASGGLLALTPIEIASGLLLTTDQARGEPDADPDRPTPRAVLEELLLPPLARAPCLVAFSGGRDSSAILAAATDVARRHGLPEPVPVTYRYGHHPRTTETEWQDAVIRHLGLADWLTVEVGNQFDVLGELATGALRRHGLFWPPNAHSMLPLLRAARGGSLLTGNGGDEVLSPWASRWIAQVRRGRLRPARKDLKWVLLGISPRPLRELAWRRHPPVELPWLRPRGRRELLPAASRRWARQTRSWAQQIEDVGRLRYVAVAESAFHAFARGAGCALVEPFLDRRLMRAIGRHSPKDGYASRGAALEALFGDLLPRETLSRSTKAMFTEVFHGPATAAFVADWDGSGVDESLVDPAVLRQIWKQSRPDFRSLTALQAAWLANAAQR